MVDKRFLSKFFYSSLSMSLGPGVRHMNCINNDYRLDDLSLIYLQLESFNYVSYMNNL